MSYLPKCSFKRQIVWGLPVSSHKGDGAIVRFIVLVSLHIHFVHRPVIISPMVGIMCGFSVAVVKTSVACTHFTGRDERDLAIDQGLPQLLNGWVRRRQTMVGIRWLTGDGWPSGDSSTTTPATTSSSTTTTTTARSSAQHRHHQQQQQQQQKQTECSAAKATAAAAVSQLKQQQHKRQ